MVTLVPSRAQQSRLLHPVRSAALGVQRMRENPRGADRHGHRGAKRDFATRAQLVRLMNWYAYLFRVKQAEER